MILLPSGNGPVYAAVIAGPGLPSGAHQDLVVGEVLGWLRVPRITCGLAVRGAQALFDEPLHAPRHGPSRAPTTGR